MSSAEVATSAEAVVLMAEMAETLSDAQLDTTMHHAPTALKRLEEGEGWPISEEEITSPSPIVRPFRPQDNRLLCHQLFWLIA